MPDATDILEAIERGDPHASEQLLPVVYAELRRLASLKMSQEKPGQTLDATALVHEAYIRLVDAEAVQNWDNTGHFFAAAAEAMRRILIENARRKQSLKRGGNLQRADVDPGDLPAKHDDDVDLLALDEALDALAEMDAIKARTVELRYFAGLTMQETADVLGVSLATAKRHWTYARAWLRREIRRGAPPSDESV